MYKKEIGSPILARFVFSDKYLLIGYLSVSLAITLLAPPPPLTQLRWSQLVPPLATNIYTHIHLLFHMSFCLPSTSHAPSYLCIAAALQLGANSLISAASVHSFLSGPLYDHQRDKDPTDFAYFNNPCLAYKATFSILSQRQTLRNQHVCLL